ncbi:RNA polymerase sigma factor [Sphingomonas sp. Sphisp140]|uniref:RNA polymerase sigma factor n=1 Tax=unclassified Sphingomonas TaxID=196159 RepID=UPI0039B11732
MSDDEATLKRDMRAAVAALPELERSVFRLCAVDGLDYPAIAERLGIDIEQVERLLVAALIAIDRHLDTASRARSLVESGAKRPVTRLHRLVRWLGLD